jgi:hypothetical protein
VYQQKHRYLSLGIEISNEPEEGSRIKMIASLLKQQSLLLDFVGVVVGLLRLHLKTHRVSIWNCEGDNFVKTYFPGTGRETRMSIKIRSKRRWHDSSTQVAKDSHAHCAFWKIGFSKKGVLLFQ